MQIFSVNMLIPKPQTPESQTKDFTSHQMFAFQTSGLDPSGSIACAQRPPQLGILRFHELLFLCWFLSSYVLKCCTSYHGQHACGINLVLSFLFRDSLQDASLPR